MKQKNKRAKRAISKLLPDNKVKTTEPPATVQDNMDSVEQMNDDHMEDLTTRDATAATEHVKTRKITQNVAAPTSGKTQSMQERTNKQAPTIGRPKAKNNDALGKANKKAKLGQNISRETRQSSAKRAENASTCGDDTNGLDGDVQQPDGKYDQTQVARIQQNTAQATEPPFRVNESSIVEHVWAKQKLSESTTKEDILKAKSLTKQVNVNRIATPFRTTSENTQTSVTTPSKPGIKKTTRKRIQTLTSPIASAKKLRSKQTQKKQVIDETLSEATNEYLRSSQTAQGTNQVIENLRQTSDKAKPKGIVKKQTRQQKDAKAKSKPNWAYLMLRRRRKDLVAAAAEVNRVSDSEHIPPSDTLQQPSGEPVELKSKPTLDKTSPGAADQRAKPCPKSRKLKQAKKTTMHDRIAFQQTKHSEVKISRNVRTTKGQSKSKTEANADAKPNKSGAAEKQAKSGNNDSPSSPESGTNQTLKAILAQPPVCGAVSLEQTEKVAKDTVSRKPGPLKTKLNRVGRKCKQMKTVPLDLCTPPEEHVGINAAVCGSVVDASDPKQEASDPPLGESNSPTKAKSHLLSKKTTQPNRRNARRRSTSAESKSSLSDSTAKETGQESHDGSTVSAQGRDRADSDVPLTRSAVESLHDEHVRLPAETGIGHVIAANGLVKTRRLVIEVEQLTTMPGGRDFSEILQTANKGCLTRRNGRKRIGPKCMQNCKRAKQKSRENSEASVAEVADQKIITHASENANTDVSKPAQNARDEDCASDNEISLAELKAKEVEQLDRSSEIETGNSEPISNTTRDQRLLSESDSDVPELKRKQDKLLDQNKEIDTVKQESVPGVPDPVAISSDTDSSLVHQEGSSCEHPDKNKAYDKVKQELPSNPPDTETILSDTDVSLTQRMASGDEHRGQSQLNNTVKHELAPDDVDGETVVSDKDVGSRSPGANDVVERSGDSRVLDQMKQELPSNTPDAATGGSPTDTIASEMDLRESGRLHNSGTSDSLMRNPSSDTLHGESLLSDTNSAITEQSNNEDQPVGLLSGIGSTKTNLKVVRLRRMPVLKAKRTQLRRLRRNLTVSRMPSINRKPAKEVKEAEPSDKSTDEEHNSITPSVEDSSSTPSDALVKTHAVQRQEGDALLEQDAHKTGVEESPPAVTDHCACVVPVKEVRLLVYPYDDDDQDTNDQEEQVGSRTPVVDPCASEDEPQALRDGNTGVSSGDANGDTSAQHKGSHHENNDTEDATEQSTGRDVEPGANTNVTAAQDNVPTTETSGYFGVNKTSDTYSVPDNKATTRSDNEDTCNDAKTTHADDKDREKEQPHSTRPQPEETADRSEDDPPLLAPEIPICEPQHEDPEEEDTTPPDPMKEADAITSHIPESSTSTIPDLTSPDDTFFDPGTSIGKPCIINSRKWLYFSDIRNYETLLSVFQLLSSS